MNLAPGRVKPTSGGNCWGQSFGYDRYANLTTITVTKCTAPMLSLWVNTQNRITNSGFSYDAAGNLTADGTYNYTWNGESRLSTAAGVTYTYDGDGRRVKKSSGTLYWYGGGAVPVAETDLSGNTTNEYIFFAEARIARRNSAGNVYYYFGDHLGSSRSITNATGTICYEADFYPFGGERVITNTCGQNYKFAGMERDSETGSDHTWFRQYASNLGRWLTPDPVAGDILNPQSLNRYAYVLNNPVKFTDPLGLWCHPDNPYCEKFGDPAGTGGPIFGGCTVDGISVPCTTANAMLSSGAGVNVTGMNTTPRPGRNGWSFFGCFADNSCGFVPASLSGLSPLDIDNFLSMMATSGAGGGVDPSNLSGDAARIYSFLTGDPQTGGLGISPNDITLYADSADHLSVVLTQAALAIVQQNLSSHYLDLTGVFHSGYTEGARDANATNSLHAVWADPRLSAYFGAPGIYAQFHYDSYNPFGGIGSFFGHAACALFGAGC